MPSEYEDKYLLLRDENTALKKKKNEQEATIKRMYTKLAMIEEKLSRKRQSEGKNNQDDPETGGNKAAVIPVRRDLDTEKFIAALKNENATLRKKNQSLMEKNRWLEEQCRQSSALKRLGSVAAPASRGPVQKRPPIARNPPSSSAGFAGNTLEKQAENARKLHRETFSGDLEVALKKRLVIAEKQLMKLQAENEQLRSNTSRLQLKPRRDNNEDSGPSDGEDDNMEANKESNNLELEQMKRELRDRQAQLAILNARYENLESNALAEREIQEKTLGQMEQMNRQVHKLRTQLQDAVMEKEELEIRIMKAGDQEKDIALLREQNRRLEERMTSLCESPFINDAFQRKERIDKLFDLEKLTQEQKATITHMTDENQKLQGVIRELQSSIKQLKQAKDRVEQDLAQMAHHLMEERNARSLEAMKSTASNVPIPRPEPLVIVRQRTPESQPQPPEKRDACSSPVNNNASPGKKPAPSLTVGGGVVTRKYGDLPSAASFLDADDDISVKHLRNRVHVLQIAHLKSMQELERCEKMLQAQTNINRELALEIEELTTSKISSSNQLQRRMKELELLCEERQQRIHALQAEIKQLKYAREKMLLKAREAEETCSDDSASDDEGSEVASLSESLILASRDLAPGEQLLEVGIVSGNFDNSVVGINSSTFVICDFYDFESQSTPLLMGNRPEYNLSATFKVTVDGFFLRYLASESVVLEVHQAIRGDFKLIGKASVRLSKLLQSKGVVKVPLLAVKAICCNNDGGAPVLGTLNVVLRLSTPVSEIWQVHLRSYPQDILLLSSASKHREPDTPTDVLGGQDLNADSSHSMNELQITVFACRKLRSYGKRSSGSVSRVPSSYVHYQLLGFPDVFTNIVPESANPEYDLSYSRQAFTLEVDATLLRFFSKFRFWITVFDDQVDLDDNAQEDGVVGKCGLMLTDLVNGENIRGWFPLKDGNDQHAGDISVLIQWKDPFQVLQLISSQRARGVHGRPIDMHSLDFDQQHALLAMFSSDLDGRINYRQFLHYADPSEELELLVAKLKERIEYAIDAELVTSADDVFTVATEPRQRKRMVISMDAFAQAGEKHGIFLSDFEREHLLATFGVADSSPENRSTVPPATGEDSKSISLRYLLLHINPRLGCVERLLCHKIRQTVHRYVQEQKKRKPADVVPAPKIFEKFDDARCGQISRSAFRKCMAALGFEFMSVESEYRELVRSHTQPGSGVIASDSIAKDATPQCRGSIDLDEDILEDVTARAKQQLKQPAHHDSEIEKKTGRAVKCAEAPTLDVSEPTASTVPPTTEFQRRKQAFTDRMKAIASASSKNLVYEQVEKKLQDRRVQAKEKAVKVSRQEILAQQVRQLHVPQSIHHDAARTLQKHYRQYKEQQHQIWEISHAKTTILDADSQLQAILAKWSFADLNGLEDAILSEIERDAPEAKRSRLLSKKQLGYFLSKAPRIALPPALLWNLMEYFSVKEAGMVAYRALLNFVFSTSTEESERGQKQRLSVLKRLLFDIGYASHTFVSAGDMKGTGIISFKKFRECLARLGAQLSAKELHLVTIMLDANGYDILYHALFQLLAQLPHCQQLTKALERCHQFGIALLREKILTFVSSDDGSMTQEELVRVLMMLSSDGAHFEPEDSSVLFRMTAGNADSTKRVSIHDLCLRLEWAEKYSKKSWSDEWNQYDMHQLQRLAWNCRKLICGSYSDLKDEFERFDWQARGFVSLTEFTSIVRRIGFVLFTEGQLKGMAKSFSVKTNGSFGINYRQFLDWTTPPLPVDMDAVEEKLRKFAHDQATKLPSRQLSEVFALWNKIFSAEAESSADRAVTRSNFVNILQTRLGVPLDEHEMRTLLYTYDPKLEDQIDPDTFLRMNWREEALARRERVKVDTESKPTAPEIKKDAVGRDSSSRVLKANTKNVLKGTPATTSPNQKAATKPTASSAPAIQPRLGRSPTAVLSDFLDWCEDRGVDFRGELEAKDTTYTGFVTAMELKDTLLRLGFANIASPSSAEVMVGQLVRQFRSPERTDAVHYTTMLYEATKPFSTGNDSQWYEQITEHLRSRIRAKASLAGKIDHADTTIYAKLDSAFSHFDREKKGFLTAANLHTGLRALSYDLTAEQLDSMMAQICVFRHSGGGLSRTEFDSFVLDPYCSRLLRKLSAQLYSEVEPHSQDTMPRVAYLSRLLMECGGDTHPSSLPKETFWTQLERALERQVSAWERLRFQHLFDVKRDGHIAYKLFLKVMSQWRAPLTVAGPVLAADSKVAEHRQVTIPQQESAVKPEKHQRRLEETTTSNTKPPCSCDAILRSLYNQMSSIDFDSQVDIVEEYLRLKDHMHTGSIKMKQLRRVFDQIGLSLSADAFTSLQMYFPGIASSGADEEQDQLVAYGKLILALEAMHEQNSDK